MVKPGLITWLASYPKSGNTWIKLLMGAYKYGTADINERRPLTALDTETYAHQVVSPVSLNYLDPAQKVYLRSAALMHLRMRNLTQCILKTHCADIKVNDVRLIPPTLTDKRIYILRDPRDVVISFAKHMGITVDRAIELFAHVGNALNMPETAPAFLTTWSRHVGSWAFNSDVVIRYEDLRDDTAGQFKRVLEVLGWEIDEARIEKAVSDCEFAKLKAQEDKDGFLESSGHGRFFNQGKSGHWQEVLTPEQIKQIESDHGEMMEKVGYILTKAEAA